MYLNHLTTFLKSIIKHKKTTILLLWVTFTLANLVIANNTRKDSKRYVFWSDAYGYYCYLPSIIIHQDVEKYTVGDIHNVTGKSINKYTSGVALLELPFFMCAYCYAIITNNNTDGFSEDFEFFITLGTITYTFLGLLFLFYILKRYVREKVAIISLLILYFGTNLYYYTIGESGFSHAYSFFAISWFFWALHQFLDKPSIKSAIQIGFAFGLAIIIRPTNILIIPIILTLNTKNINEIYNRLKFYIKSKYSLIALFVSIIPIIPQMIYWKTQSGSILYYSYPGESFDNILNPKISVVLFGNVAGFFVYSAIFIACIPGIYLMFKRTYSVLAITILFIFSAITYVNASWWTPTFDCSYGPRAFIEYYPFLIIPFAFFVDSLNRNWKKLTFGFSIVLLLFINIRFTYLYKKYPCWKNDDIGNEWTWNTLGRVLRVSFYIEPEPRYYFLIDDKPKVN